MKTLLFCSKCHKAFESAILAIFEKVNGDILCNDCLDKKSRAKNKEKYAPNVETDADNIMTEQ